MRVERSLSAVTRHELEAVTCESQDASSHFGTEHFLCQYFFPFRNNAPHDACSNSSIPAACGLAPHLPVAEKRSRAGSRPSNSPHPTNHGTAPGGDIMNRQASPESPTVCSGGTAAKPGRYLGTQPRPGQRVCHDLDFPVSQRTETGGLPEDEGRECELAGVRRKVWLATNTTESSFPSPPSSTLGPVSSPLHIRLPLTTFLNPNQQTSFLS